MYTAKGSYVALLGKNLHALWILCAETTVMCLKHKTHKACKIGQVSLFGVLSVLISWPSPIWRRPSLVIPVMTDSSNAQFFLFFFK